MTATTGIRQRYVTKPSSNALSGTRASDAPLPIIAGGTGARTATEAAAKLGVPSLTGANTFAGANTFTNALTEVQQLHANVGLTTDGTVTIEEGVISAVNLTGAVTLTLPDRSGELAVTTDIVGGLADGDYGDVVVSGSGTVMTIDPTATIEADSLIAGDSGLFAKKSGANVYAAFEAGSLSESRTFTFPDQNGTFMLSGSLFPLNFTFMETGDAYTLQATDVVVRVTAGATMTLPAADAVLAGKLFIVKNGSPSVSVDVLATAQTEYIDENTTATLAPLGFVHLMSDGTNRWVVIGAQGVTLSGGYD